MQIIQHTPAAAGSHSLSLKRPPPAGPNPAQEPAPEPLPDDPPDAAPTCGWFGSSLELKQGLEVVELQETGRRRHPFVAQAAAGARWPLGAPARP